MTLLNKQTISEIASGGRITVGPLTEYPEKVIQFGEGNFLRAFVDWMFDELNSKDLFHGRVITVQPLPGGMIEKINRQNGLYTLILRGIQDGKTVERRRIITSISRGINPYTQWKEFITCAELPELRYVVSNTTEAGIEYVPITQPQDECPASFPAKLAAFLFHRYKHFAGAQNRGMVVLPCELIEQNGTLLKEYILKHAGDWSLDAGFAEWIENACLFFNTLVDRIVPGYPADEAKALTGSLGYEDELIDTGEPFHLWVLEGDRSVSRELPFIDAGLKVLWTNDLQPYRTRKVRILNGAHTMSVLAAYQCGRDTVREMVNDETLGTFMRKGIFDEIIPTLDLPENEKKDFALKVIERFQNPFIKHQLLSIALNSVSKFKVRVLPSLLKYVEIKNELPSVIAFSLAALITFYRGRLDESGRYFGVRNQKPYEIKDSQEHLQFLNKQWETNGSNLRELVMRILSNKSMWDIDLSLVPGLADNVSSSVSLITQSGMQSALSKIVK